MTIQGLLTIHSGKVHYPPGVAFEIADEFGNDLVKRGFATEVHPFVPPVQREKAESPEAVPVEPPKKK